MCKACRQRSIWARIKLLSLISVWQWKLPSHSSEFQRNILCFVFHSLSTWYLKFSRKAEASLGCLQLPDTHAYRFVDQFLKNTLFRADEVRNYKILFLRVKAVGKFIFDFLSARRLSIGRVENYAEALFSCQVVFKNFFSLPTQLFRLSALKHRSGVGILRTVSLLSNHPLGKNLGRLAPPLILLLV